MPHLRVLTVVCVAVAVGCASEPSSTTGSGAAASSGAEQPAVAQAAPKVESSTGRAKASADRGTAPANNRTATPAHETRSRFDTPLHDCRIESDYNQCVVDRLDGRTQSEQELMAVIQSQRMLGEVEPAKRNMRTFIERYPDSPMVQTYRQYLDNY